MKKLNLAVLIFINLLAAQFINAQQPHWTIPPYEVNFSGNSLSFSASNLQTPMENANGAYDKSNKLIFYVTGEKIYLPNATSPSLVLPSLNQNIAETGVVLVPGSCNRFYIIRTTQGADRSYPFAKLYYSMIEINNNTITLVQGYDNIDLGSIGNYGANFAISKLRKDKTRLLFTIGKDINKYIITRTGIVFQATLFNIISSVQGPDFIGEVELYEDPNSGGMRLGWGESWWQNSTADCFFHIANLNNQGNFINTQIFSLAGNSSICGVEFFDNGAKAFVTNTSGINVVDITSNTNSLIANSVDYRFSQVEKAADGKYYVLGNNQLASISTTTFAVTNELSLPANTTSMLPNQVDDENYAATNYRAELMAKDGILDIGVEPNTDTDIWASPDLWNRRNNSGNPDEHQNPGFQPNGDLGNLMKIRVTNIGCETSSESKVRLYWTLGATGEHWPGSWNGTETLPGNTLPAGGEINISSTYSTYSNGYIIPPLAPGNQAVIQAKWLPPNPVSFGLPAANTMICFLGRIDDPAQDPMYDEQSSPTTSTKHNIAYNNNVVTRNTTLINLPGSYMVVPPRGGTVLVNNYLEAQTEFDIFFKPISPNDAKFTDIANITLQLDESLWNSWMEGGQSAKGLKVSDAKAHEVVVYDIDNAVLQNISMKPGQYMSISALFQLKDITGIEDEFRFSFSQQPGNAKNEDEKYGTECYYIITVNGEEDTDVAGAEAHAVNAKSSMQTMADNLTIYPNPSNNEARVNFTTLNKEKLSNIRIMDMAGKLVKQFTINNTYRKGRNIVAINTANIADGIYTVVAQFSNRTQSVKLNVTH